MKSPIVISEFAALAVTALGASSDVPALGMTAPDVIAQSAKVAANAFLILIFMIISFIVLFMCMMFYQ